MAEETVLSQGTALYLLDTLSSSEPQIVKFNCPTGIPSFGGGPTTRIPTTCLENLEGETDRPGLNQVQNLSIPFNFKPTRFSHRILYDMKRSKDTFQWCVRLSDGTDAPTLDTDGSLVAPATGTSFLFEADVDNVLLDIATNTIVTGTLSLYMQAEGIEEFWNGDPVNDADIVAP